MNIYFTSDLHFNHDRDFIYKPRGYNTLYEMNKSIIENWNSIVKEDDLVYVLGDLMLGDNNIAIELVKQLKGNIIVVLGNHDTDRRIEYYENCSNIIEIKYADRIKYNGYTFYLSHYPTFTGNLDHEKPLKARVLNLFGHTHSSEKFYDGNPTMYNVSLDAHNNKVVLIDSIIEDIKNRYKEYPRQKDIDINIKPYINFIDRCKEKL